jgi:RNA polymerase sigma-70 factor (ECF subfamily)
MNPLEDSEIEVALYTSAVSRPDRSNSLQQSVIAFFIFYSGKPIICWCMLREAFHFSGCHLLTIGLRSIMSSHANGRALPTPLVWTGTQKRFAAPSEPTLRSPSDDQLMARLKSRDTTALEILFVRYSRLVSGIAFRIVRDYGEAEEVVQEAFFYIYQKSSLFDPTKGSAKAWIVQVAYSRALDRKAHLSRRHFYVGTEIDSLDDTLMGKSDVEREIGARFDLAHLQQAFRSLTQTQRRTIELFYFEGLELREISEELQEPLGNVRHHFYRGLERLRKDPTIRKLSEKTRDAERKTPEARRA